MRLEPETIAAEAAYLREHLGEILGNAPEQGRARLAPTVARPCDAAGRDELAKRISDTFTPTLGGPRAVAQAIERMDQCIAQGAHLAPAIEKRFGKP